MNSHIACGLSASLEVFRETESGGGVAMEAAEVVIVEVSDRGARLKSKEMSDALFRCLVEKLRYGRLKLPPSGGHGGEPLLLMGQVAWIGAHSRRGTEIALAFMRQEPGCEAAIEELTERAKGSASPASHAKPDRSERERWHGADHFPGGTPAALCESAAAFVRKSLEELEKASKEKRSFVEPSSNFPVERKNRRERLRVHCHFPAEFRLRFEFEGHHSPEFQVMVIDVSWEGLRLEFAHRDSETARQLLRALARDPEVFAMKRHGWIDFPSPYQRLAASARIVHMRQVGSALGPESERKLQMGLALDGPPEATKYMRLALMERAVSSVVEPAFASGPS